MNYASEAAVFETPNLEEGVALIEKVVEQARLRRSSDFISRVVLLASPHFASLIESLAHTCISKTNCLNIWGGCVSGLLHGGKVYGQKPALMLAVFGEAFEPAKQKGAGSKTISLCLAETDHLVMEQLRAGLGNEPGSDCSQADTLGLLSYGANYLSMPRLEFGRLCHQPHSTASLSVSQPLTLNSEGLEFFTEVKTVTESNGLFLLKVDGVSAALALGCPEEQTKPVGLRLQVIDKDRESWIPVLSLHADGTMCLVAPVAKGQQIRLARRTPNAVHEEFKAWQPLIATHFGGQAPAMGLLIAGFERSEMCHDIDDDVAQILKSFPDTDIIGIFGQANWLGLQEKVLAPPRNNRLSLCLFNPNS